MISVIILSVIVLIACADIQCQEDFSYQNIEAWGGKCKTGKSQSPIDLDLTKIEKSPCGSFALTCLNYDKNSDSTTITNTGHTVQLSAVWSKDDQPIVEVNTEYVKGQYIFDNFHLHWGQFNNNGTEHTINGESYSEEGHLFHFNAKYGNFNNAMKHRDGILVIVFLFKISEKGNTGLSQLAEALSAVRQPNSSISVQSVSLSGIGLDCGKDFLYYSGSLDTPPCTENVAWFFPSTFIEHTTEDMKKLRTLQLNHGDTNNVRPIQQLNNRKILHYSFN